MPFNFEPLFLSKKRDLSLEEGIDYRHEAEISRQHSVVKKTEYRQ